MSDIYEIGMGQLYVADAPFTLYTSSIGSCIAICLYSATQKKGALAHIMLPKRPDSDQPITEADHRYADVALAIMVTELEHRGVPKNLLTAKIVGGANMFPEVQGRSHKVGDRNIEAVQELLTAYQIDLAASETGGNSGRACAFDLSNGIVSIKITI